jgi:hypothetical protein
MKLRDHPLIMRCWPPVWSQRTASGTKTLTGEIGTLKYVLFFDGESVEIILVVIEEETHFVGKLTVWNPAFCRRLAALLKANIGRSIKEIGDIEIPDEETPVEALCA